MFADYKIEGMALMTIHHFKFRSPLPTAQEYLPNTTTQTEEMEKIWTISSTPSELIHGEKGKYSMEYIGRHCPLPHRKQKNCWYNRSSHCALEFDITAASLQPYPNNTNSQVKSLAVVPSLAMLWKV